MSQAITISSTRLINFNYDFANCCVTIATMTIKQDLRIYTNKFLNLSNICGFDNDSDSSTEVEVYLILCK